MDDTKQKAAYPIKAASLRTGLSPHVIRIWERRYGAVEPERTATNRRRYNEEQIERLNLLRIATGTGVTISEAAGLDNSELREIARRNTSRQQERPPLEEQPPAEEPVSPEDHVRACLDCVRRYDGRGLDRALDRAAVAFTRPVLLERVILPLAEQVGSMWREGELRIVHEHMATAIIRTHLARMVDNAGSGGSSPLMAVATPEGQLHELGALAAAATASADGWSVAYLGPGLPVEEIAAAVNALGCRYLVLSIVHPEDDPSLSRELERLGRLLPPGVEVVAGGSAAKSYAGTLRSFGCRIIDSLSDFRAFLSGSGARSSS